MLLINLTDIKNYCKIGFNVTGWEQFVLEAQDELEPKLNSDLMAAFEALVTANYEQWNRQKTYAVNDKIIWQGIQYKCILISTANEPPNATYWTVQDLQTAFNYIKQYLSYLAYSKFLVEHGIEVQASGLVKYSGADSQTVVSSSERAALVNKYKNKSDKVFSDFLKWISDESYVIDGVTYSFSGSDIVSHRPNWGFA